MHTPNRHRRSWRRLIAQAGAVTLTAALPTVTLTSATGTPANAGSETAISRPATVLLPTGEQIAVQWSGGQPLVSQPPGQRATLTVVTCGGRTYALPAESMPYLDRTLDRGLFDVTALAAAERRASAGRAVRVPLTVTGAATVPGMHVTGPSTGWLDAAGAATFGVALRDGIRRDATGARGSAAVPGLNRLTLAGAGTTGTARPDYPMETLSVTLTPPAGRTVLAAAVLIVNTDDTRTYDGFVAIIDNLAKISVPKGHYTLIGDVLTAAPDGSRGTDYLPIRADYEVTTTNQSTNLDANQATAMSTYTTPAATTPDALTTQIGATDGTHDRGGLTVLGYTAEDQVLVQPTPTPVHGALEYDTVEHRTDTSGADWDLTWEWTTGIPPDLHRTVEPRQLATVTDRVFADGATGAISYGRGPVYPDLRGGLAFDLPTAATHHTSHLYAPPDVRWAGAVSRAVDAAATAEEYLQGIALDYTPGRSYRADWFRESLAPGFPSTVTFPRPYCVACRTDDQLSLLLPSELDGTAGDNGTLSGQATGYTRLRVSEDGTPIADQPDTDTVIAPVRAGNHHYRIESTVDRSALGFTAATHTSAVYTVDSSTTSGAPLPGGWACPATGTGACTILPLLTTTMPLPTDQNDTLPPGPNSFVVTVGHLPSATTSAVTTLTVATAVGATGYTPATIHPLGRGRYRVTLNLPRLPGQPLSFRLHAEDAAGSTLTQTVTAAATIAG